MENNKFDKEIYVDKIKKILPSLSVLIDDLAEFHCDILRHKRFKNIILSVIEVFPKKHILNKCENFIIIEPVEVVASLIPFMIDILKDYGSIHTTLSILRYIWCHNTEQLLIDIYIEYKSIRKFPDIIYMIAIQKGINLKKEIYKLKKKGVLN